MCIILKRSHTHPGFYKLEQGSTWYGCRPTQTYTQGKQRETKGLNKSKEIAITWKSAVEVTS